MENKNHETPFTGYYLSLTLNTPDGVVGVGVVVAVEVGFGEVLAAEK